MRASFFNSLAPATLAISRHRHSPRMLIAVYTLLTLLVPMLAERVEIKPYKTFCFFEELEMGQNYGVQFQSEEGEFHVYVYILGGLYLRIITPPFLCNRLLDPRVCCMIRTRKFMDRLLFLPSKLAGTRSALRTSKPKPAVSTLTSSAKPRTSPVNIEGCIFYVTPIVYIEEKLDQAQIELRDLNAGLRSLRDEQEYLLQREITHKQSTLDLIIIYILSLRVVAVSTNKRVMYWFVFQLALLGSVGYFQIYYLKRFFEVRRVV